MIIRFDEWAGTDAPKAPDKPPQLRTGKKDEAPLVVDKQGGKLVLVPRGSSAPQKPGGPQGQVDAPDRRTFEVEGLIPLTCEVRRQGLRQGDEASITFALADFPFDPRAVRSCAVQVYMGTVSAGDFALASEGLSHEDASGGQNRDPTPLSAVQDYFVDPYGEQRSNLRFSGFVDDYSADFPKDDQPTVTLECLDNTKLLADQPAPPKLAMSADLPVDEAVAAYLANFPQCEGLTVELRPEGADRPTLKGALAKTAYKPDLGPPSDGKGTALDYLSDCVMAVGLVLFVEDTAVVLQRPRTLYAGAAVRPNDPFTGRILPSGRVLERRTLIWGNNIEELSFGRKYGRTAAQSVECRSYSGRQKKTLVARHPPKGKRPTSSLPGGATDEKWRVVEVAGIESEEALRAIAQAVYEYGGRRELTCRVRTPNLGSLGGGNLDPDLLDVCQGDALDVEANRGDFAEGEDAVEGGWAADIAAGEGGSAAARYLVRLGYSDALAEAYAKCLASSAFPTTFRVRTWSLAWDSETGIVVSGELMNYVEARMDQELPEGEESPVAETASSPVQVRVD